MAFGWVESLLWLSSTHQTHTHRAATSSGKWEHFVRLTTNDQTAEWRYFLALRQHCVVHFTVQQQHQHTPKGQ